jgi:dipeptidyl aminopeptidase/acylaminoacyl peptidase
MRRRRGGIARRAPESWPLVGVDGLSPEDRFRLVAIGDVQCSPDGALVAFVQQCLDLEADEARTAIWIVPADGSAPSRRLTWGRGDRHPRWSPDGRALAFVSERAGRPQLYVIDRAGGEARRLETTVDAASPPVWSPDGTRIAFVAQVEVPPPGPRHPGEPESLRARSGSRGPRVIAAYDYRFDGRGYFDDRYAHVHVVPADGSGGERRLTEGRFGHDEPCWTPDGRALIVRARRSEAFDPRAGHDLWRVDAASGELTPFLPWDGLVSAPRFSPDGDWLAFVGLPRERNDGVAPACLWVMAADGSAPSRNLTAELDRPVGGAIPCDLRYGMGGEPFAWHGDRLRFLVASEGRSAVYEVGVDGGRPVRVPLTDLPVVAAFSGEAVLAGGPTQPEQILVGGRVLTAFNAAAAAAALPVERFRVTSEPGWEVDGWLIRPRGYEPGRRYPTILSIHGGPTGVYGDTYSYMFQMLADHGYAVVYANPRGSVTYGERFTAGMVGDWGGGDFRDLMACVDHVVGMGVADPERLGVTGWSYGGYMTCWAITQTGRFRAAVAGAPISNVYTLWGVSDIGVRTQERLFGGPAYADEERYMARSPMRHVANVRTPTLILHGESDLRCPLEQSEQFFAALQRLGVPAAYVRYPGEAHALTKPRHIHDRLARTLGWFDHWLKG